MPHAGSRRGRDLKATLLEHGIALAREGGPDAVSLRDVQRRAGVSNTAAYRHYAHRDALLIAISEYAAGEMGEEMERQMAMAEARRPPPRHHRMTTRASPHDAGPAPGSAPPAAPTSPSPCPSPACSPWRCTRALTRTRRPPPPPKTPAASGPYELLVSCVDELVTTGVLAPERRAYTDVSAWAAVHGLAVLLLDGPLAELGPDEQQAAIDRLLDLVDAGLH